MNIEEVITLVKECGFNVETTKHSECEKVVLNALEKQIPKKPIKKNPICYAKTKYGQEYFAFDYFCPNCNEQIKLSEHHCKCGQALDWSDTNART